MSRKHITIHDSSSESSSGDDLGFIWAQCDSNTCQKWRKLEKDLFQKEGKQDQKWYCWMNSDANHNDCSKPEEKWESEEYKYNQEFELHSIVNAKYGVYPFWPALISLSPDKRKFTNRKKSLYHVEFFGKTQTRGWVKTHKIELLSLDSQIKVGSASKYYSRVKEAFEEAKKALKIEKSERYKLLDHQGVGSILEEVETKYNERETCHKNLTSSEYVCTSNSSSPCTSVLNSETFVDFSELHQYGKRLLVQMETLLAKINQNT